jgi:hypothetical protein
MLSSRKADASRTCDNLEETRRLSAELGDRSVPFLQGWSSCFQTFSLSVIRAAISPQTDRPDPSTFEPERAGAEAAPDARVRHEPEPFRAER